MFGFLAVDLPDKKESDIRANYGLHDQIIALQVSIGGVCSNVSSGFRGISKSLGEILLPLPSMVRDLVELLSTLYFQLDLPMIYFTEPLSSVQMRRSKPHLYITFFLY